MGKTAEHYFAEHPKSVPRFGLIRAYLRGRSFEFLTASGVFSKNRIDLGTRLLIESMVLPEEGHVLDVGCGYGPIGIVVAALNPRLEVTLIDVNSRALRLAKRNVEKNCLCLIVEVMCSCYLSRVNHDCGSVDCFASEDATIRAWGFS